MYVFAVNRERVPQGSICELRLVRDSLRAAGVEPAASTPTELAALVQADRARWATLIKQKQLKME